jgi:hypothetical protein
VTDKINYELIEAFEFGLWPPFELIRRFREGDSMIGLLKNKDFSAVVIVKSY